MECTCDYIIPTQEGWEPHYQNCKLMWKGEMSTYPKNEDGTLRLNNKYLKLLDYDVLYHLGFDTKSLNFESMFGDVKFVCVGGTKYRMKEVAKYMGEVLGIKCDLQNLAKKGHRFSMFKVGPVLCVSHGIGIASMTVVLEEVFKMLHYAKAKDPIVFRLGTSGGLGLPKGSVVVTSHCVSDTLENCYNLAILGKVRKFPSTCDQRLNQEILSIANSEDFLTTPGGTFAANDFYRGEGRTDGAFCDYSEADKDEFLQTLLKMGVKNIDMEATAFAAFTREAGVRSAVICCTLLDRLKGDQLTEDPKILSQWQCRPAIIVGKYIKNYLQKCQNKT